MDLASLAEKTQLAGVAPERLQQGMRVRVRTPFFVFAVEYRKRQRQCEQRKQIQAESSRHAAIETVTDWRPQAVEQ
jgi:hypothetical protein